MRTDEESRRMSVASFSVHTLTHLVNIPSLLVEALPRFERQQHFVSAMISQGDLHVTRRTNIIFKYNRSDQAFRLAVRDHPVIPSQSMVISTQPGSARPVGSCQKFPWQGIRKNVMRENCPLFQHRHFLHDKFLVNDESLQIFGHSDEVRILTQQQDLYTLPCESFLYVEGRLTVKKKNDRMPTALGNIDNCVAFMFDRIRYELNGVEIDSNRNVEVTNTIKNYVSMTYDKALIVLNAGWYSRSDMEKGYFNFCVPLNMLLNFFEGYKRVIVNARHELILIQARNDYNCLMGNRVTEPEVELFKVQWRMHHVALNEINKLSMLRTLESGYLIMRKWLADILDPDDVIVETLDAHYEDVKPLSNLNDCNTIRGVTMTLLRC
ncbi:hypothetical protein ALC57_18304 [Trachymyrmex cornetzi]|uniref:Double jelly roll-like domain-containing protein n=1 Tax=Trachymyrmex cornetzi TaxID=471704 RepID=A0A151IS88_9HYME|nr:hypothetical protein ALC57_18304 [Trachymyrmex cornetzi]